MPKTDKTVTVSRRALKTLLDWFDLDDEGTQQEQVDKVLPTLRKAMGMAPQKLDA